MPETRPNIILLITDQQRGDCLGLDPHSPAVLQTPNLDHIARSGLHCTRAYAECPSCIPARRSLMTGTAPAANGVVGFQGSEWRPAQTLAGALSGAGYQTEMIGKMHLDPPRKRFGFDHVQLANATRGAENDYVEWLQKQRGRTEIDPGMVHGATSNGWVGRPHHLPEEEMHSFWCVDRAMDFLQKRDPSTPFFLNISFIDPHPPLTPPAFYYERYIRRQVPDPVIGDWVRSFDSPQKGLHPDAWEIRLPEEEMRCTRAAYYGMVNFIDDQIGRLCQHARGLLDECLILFVSDHGEMLGDHHLFRKTWPYEASARIPFFARAPKSWGLPPEQVCKNPVGLQDLMPTILDAAGIEVPAICTGKSLLPVLRGEADGVRTVLHGEHAGCYAYEHGNHFLVDDRNKYVWYSQTGREHLFDLENDPQEECDLALAGDAEAQLQPWRAELVEILGGRPEGCVENGALVKGRPHRPIMPGYDPEQTFPFA